MGLQALDLADIPLTRALQHWFTTCPKLRVLSVKSMSCRITPSQITQALAPEGRPQEIRTAPFSGSAKRYLHPSFRLQQSHGGARGKEAWAGAKPQLAQLS